MTGLTRSGDHPGTGPDGKLHRHQPDPTGRPVDDHGVTRPDRDGPQGVHRRRAGEHQTAGLLEGDRRRLGEDRAGRHDQLGGISARHRVGDHLVTGPQRAERPPDDPAAHLGTDGGDHAGDLEADRHRQL